MLQEVNSHARRMMQLSCCQALRLLQDLACSWLNLPWLTRLCHFWLAMVQREVP